MRVQPDDSTIRWVPVFNDTAEEIPPYAPMRVTGINNDGYKVAQPNTDGQTDILINGEFPIPAGEVGQAHASSPCQVYYDSGDGTPAAGETWGAAAGSWKIRKNKAGTKIIGGANATATVVNVLHTFAATGSSSSGITIAEVDGSPSYTGITTLTVDSADGLSISQPAANQARLDIAAATPSQTGVITTTTQTIGGEKTFLSDLTKMTAVTGGGSFIDINPYNAYVNVGPYSRFGKDGSDAYTFISHTNSISSEVGSVKIYGDIGAGQGRVVFDHNLNSGGVYPSIGLGYNSGLTRVYGLADTGTVGAIFPTRVVSGITISATSLSDPGADRIYFWDDSAGVVAHLTVGTGLSISGTTISATGAVADADYGDVTVSGSGATWTIDSAAVALAKIANASANSKLLGSGASGSGSSYTEITLGTNLSMSGTTLNASGSGSSSWSRHFLTMGG